jgi:hypothetical protein
VDASFSMIKRRTLALDEHRACVSDRGSRSLVARSGTLPGRSINALEHAAQSAGTTRTQQRAYYVGAGDDGKADTVLELLERATARVRALDRERARQRRRPLAVSRRDLGDDLCMPSSPLFSADQQPEDLAVEVARESLKKWGMRLADWGRAWFTGKLVALIVAGVVSVVGAFVALPWVVAAGCTIVVAAALTWAVAARRLMHVERARRRWQEVGLVRVELRAVRAERALAAAILDTAGHPADRRRAPVHPDVKRALAHRDARIRASAEEAAAGPRAANAEQRSSRPSPPAFDVEPVRARLAHLDAEIKALDAHIASLADTSDRPAVQAARESAQEAREARNAALEADRLARDRRRRGLPATAAEGEQVLRMTLDSAGNRNVTREPAASTPEQIAPPRKAPAGPKAD